MKKSIIQISAAGRRRYEKPSTMVYTTDIQHLMITLSDKERTLNIQEEEEEGWPVISGTDQQYAPW